MTRKIIVQQILQAVRRTNQLNQQKKKKQIDLHQWKQRKYYLSNIYESADSRKEKR
jgi:hypothetical protein